MFGSMRSWAAPWALLVFAASAPAAAVISVVPGYRSQADNPMFPYGAATAIEDFEDGAFDDIPAGSISAGFGGGVLGPSNNTDSIDGDVTGLDFYGDLGYSYYPASTLVTIFSSNNYPTFGVVVTDIGGNPTGPFGFGTFLFEAYAPDLSTLVASTTFSFGDGSPLGFGVSQTMEDYYIQVSDPNGIGAIRIVSLDNSTDWEIDHVTVSSIAVPEASTWMLCSLAMAAAILVARKRRGLATQAR